MREISIGDFRKNMAKELEDLPFVLSKNGVIVCTLLSGFVKDLGSETKNKKDFVQSDEYTDDLSERAKRDAIADKIRKKFNIPPIEDQEIQIPRKDFNPYSKDKQVGIAK